MAVVDDHDDLMLFTGGQDGYVLLGIRWKTLARTFLTQRDVSTIIAAEIPHADGGMPTGVAYP